MHPVTKKQYQQINLSFPRKELWAKFPQANRVRCRELIVQLLQAVVLTPSPPNPSHGERKN